MGLLHSGCSGASGFRRPEHEDQRWDQDDGDANQEGTPPGYADSTFKHILSNHLEIFSG